MERGRDRKGDVMGRDRPWGGASGRGQNFGEGKWEGLTVPEQLVGAGRTSGEATVSSGVRISVRLMRGVRSSVWTVGWRERTLGRGYGGEESQWALVEGTGNGGRT